MDTYTIYTVLAVLIVVYLFITITNRRKSGRRKDKKFMEGYKRRDRDKDEEKR